MTILALPPHDPSLVAPAIITSMTTALKPVEQAGQRHHIYSMIKMGFMDPPTKPKEQDNSGEEEEELQEGQEARFDKDKMKNKKKKKHGNMDGITERSFYEVLGIAHIGLNATENDIRKAHRKKTLKHHPDKVGAENYTAHAKAVWLEVDPPITLDPKSLRDSDHSRQEDQVRQYPRVRRVRPRVGQALL